MAFDESRRLRRGLKDLSPLFVHGEEKPKPAPIRHAPRLEPVGLPSEPTIEIMSAYCPDLPGDSLFLNSYLASSLAAARMVCSILSIRAMSPEAGVEHSYFDKNKIPSVQPELLGERLKRLDLTWEQFSEICDRPLLRGISKGVQSQALFLDFDYPFLPDGEKVFSLLDKWILLLRPTLENITETYRLIKETSYVKRGAEYFIFYEGTSQDPKGEVLFERLSDMVAKYLGIHLNWLGYLNLREPPERLASNLALSHLFQKPIREFDAPEKIALADFAHSFTVPEIATAS